jgi:hypothetical protein
VTNGRHVLSLMVEEISRTFATQDEAIRWKREQGRAMERGEWIDPSLSSISFAEWSTKWLEAKTDITPSTRRGYIARLNTHLASSIWRLKTHLNNQ